jgi:hypothetical protein
MLFALFMFLLCSFGVLQGVLMLYSPKKHKRFTRRLRYPFRRPPPAVEYPLQGLELSERFAGLIIAAFFLVIGGLTLRGLLDGSLSAPETNPTPQLPATTGEEWVPISGGIALIVAGIYIIMHPETIHKWSAKSQGVTLIEPPSASRLRRGALVLGVCFILSGAACVLLAVFRRF